MKNLKKKLLVAIMATAAVTCMFGFTACGDSNDDGNTGEVGGTPTEGLEFTEINGGYEVTGIGTTKETDIVIPSTYNGKSVISIHGGVTYLGDDEEDGYIYEGAFFGCTDIASVYIPESIVAIGEGAFLGCNNLETVTLCKGVTTIGAGAFYRCSSLTSIFIPDSVIFIGEAAFAECVSLTSISIPDSVTTVGNEAFGFCDNLKYNEYDNALYLGNSDNPYVLLVEAKDYEITSCIINEKTKIICDYAFAWTWLTSINIPNGVISIGESAFDYCGSLTAIYIPSSVTYISKPVFYVCNSLTIYCEVNQKPSGWCSEWNYRTNINGVITSCPVVWGYKG